ncbi:MAG: hypothetical protein R6X14_09790, partial [bacterium]
MSRRMIAGLLCLAFGLTAGAGTIEPLLQEQLAELDREERVEVMVVLAEQLDGESIIRTLKDKALRR